MKRLLIFVMLAVMSLTTGAFGEDAKNAAENEFPKVKYFSLDDKYEQFKEGKIIADLDDQLVLKQTNIQQQEVMEVVPKTTWLKATIRDDSAKPQLDLVRSAKDLGSNSIGKNNH